MRNDTKKIIGYLLIALSTACWLSILAMPFLDFTKTQIAAGTTFLVIAGELTFYAAILLLGKEVWEKIVSVFVRKKK